ncbi:hypothetical protein MXM41_18220 [Leclercia adecarboxylata]|uniref:hypothetical protein n=1 Tax=Leclercia adecarboxylata TaxID=83655 RepID=UPI002DB667D1|nr:hypothetical protein [Leclercia adecarboxylata]MEB6380845.1 hypothetical protein [Leclercia adecarboxylata]
MKCNALMSKILQNAQWNDLALPEELSSWVDKGFVKQRNCVFLAALFHSYPKDEYLFDKTGVECFVNSFHIDDYVAERYLEYSCLFCNAIFNKWHQEGNSEKLNMIVSMDEFGAVIKFHVIRQGENWLSHDLEKYEDAIFVTNDIIRQ